MRHAERHADDLRIDPTDDYRVIERERMLRGICSAPDCRWPIAAWCPVCRAKVCLDHLNVHRNTHAREAMRQLPARDEFRDRWQNPRQESPR